MGFHSFWLPENHFGKSHSVPAPLLLLAAVAARTSRIKLGCVSYLLPIRNALLAAEEVAVLDQLCEGRLILGLGRGIQSQVFDAFGIDSADKRELFAERLQTMRRAWRGEPIARDGKGQEIVLSPLPRQSPEPPLWVAAIGPKALRQVAGLGLPYLASPLEPLDRLKENYRNFHQFVAEAGLAPVSTVPVMRSVYISEDDRQVRALKSALADQVPPSMRARSGPVEQWTMIGSLEYVEDQIGLHREELGMSHLILRGGLPGISAYEQLQSHQRLMYRWGM
jgi:alkanesulfonate monooxygenase SsuD/methylene tetrahydromethanopterin reductase-like flavin-dependent oxidoreductase (luciferase family)